MSKLFEVVYVIRSVVVATDIESAYAEAQSAWRDVKGDQEPFADIGNISSLTDLPDGWDEQCFPYGDHQGKRIKEYLP